MRTDCSYICDECGSEYHFINSYDSYSRDFLGNYIETQYLIQGWYGEYDGEEVCENCQERM